MKLQCTYKNVSHEVSFDFNGPYVTIESSTNAEAGTIIIPTAALKMACVELMRDFLVNKNLSQPAQQPDPLNQKDQNNNKQSI